MVIKKIKASANAIDPERLKFKHQIVSADMQLDRMGVKQNGLLGAYKQGLSIIESLDVNDAEKKRMIEEIRAELNIEDSEYEEIK